MEKYTAAQMQANTEEDIAKYDPELRFRKLSGLALKLTFAMMIILSLFHLHTAGFGVLQEWRHRAFHLAFVLPLVYFLYSMRKADTTGRKHLIFDLLYGLISAALVTTLFREIFRLENGAALLLAVVSFSLILYFKRRQFLKRREFLYLDLLIFTLMTGALIYAAYITPTVIDFKEAFKDLNITLVFWSVLLFASFFAIIALFALQWLRTIWLVATGRVFSPEQDNIPYFDVFLAIFASAISVYIFLEFNSLAVRAGLPSQADLVVGAFAFLLILEGARRSIGPALPIISVLVLFNSYLGPYFLDIPGLSFFAHRGYSVERIIALGATVIGYLRAKLTIWQRFILGIAASTLLYPGLYTDLFGFVVLSSIYIYQRKYAS